MDVIRRMRPMSVQDASAGRGQTTDEPVRLDRVGDPGLGPPLADAASDGAGIDFASILVKQGQLAAGLVQPPLEPAFLDECWPTMDVPKSVTSMLP